MVTDIYMANNKPKKSNIKSVSMFDETPPLTQEEYDNKKKVHFKNETPANSQQTNSPSIINKKRKLGDGTDVLRSSKITKSNNKLDLIRLDSYLL
jgi:hypothetical protein